MLRLAEKMDPLPTKQVASSLDCKAEPPHEAIHGGSPASPHLRPGSPRRREPRKSPAGSSSSPSLGAAIRAGSSSSSSSSTQAPPSSRPARTAARPEPSAAAAPPPATRETSRPPSCCCCPARSGRQAVGAACCAPAHLFQLVLPGGRRTCPPARLRPAAAGRASSPGGEPADTSSGRAESTSHARQLPARRGARRRPAATCARAEELCSAKAPAGVGGQRPLPGGWRRRRGREGAPPAPHACLPARRRMEGSARSPTDSAPTRADDGHTPLLPAPSCSLRRPPPAPNPGPVLHTTKEPP
ncbi:translation initiation factor IF-2-like [Hemicordylus capensis]|uniref:translation initiation factor IF-2-like n=1 Tax=Hemicordylus capensis TaxID=884348 RepID=UPI002304A854|nr:translation initiation factor IF-2-like [Hemicordylus capensis]